jgi:hypothetical protein
MQLLSNILLVFELALFIIILGNMGRLLSDYLITKIK